MREHRFKYQVTYPNASFTLLHAFTSVSPCNLSECEELAGRSSQYVPSEQIRYFVLLTVVELTNPSCELPRLSLAPPAVVFACQATGK